MSRQHCVGHQPPSTWPASSPYALLDIRAAPAETSRRASAGQASLTPHPSRGGAIGDITLCAQARYLTRGSGASRWRRASAKDARLQGMIGLTPGRLFTTHHRGRRRRVDATRHALKASRRPSDGTSCRVEDQRHRAGVGTRATCRCPHSQTGRRPAAAGGHRRHQRRAAQEARFEPRSRSADAGQEVHHHQNNLRGAPACCSESRIASPGGRRDGGGRPGTAIAQVYGLRVPAQPGRCVKRGRGDRRLGAAPSLRSPSASLDGPAAAGRAAKPIDSGRADRQRTTGQCGETAAPPPAPKSTARCTAATRRTADHRRAGRNLPELGGACVPGVCPAGAERALPAGAAPRLEIEQQGDRFRPWSLDHEHRSAGPGSNEAASIRADNPRR